MRLRNKIILAAVSMAAVFIALYIVNFIMTPRWSFEVTTNKTVYSLGEDVQITVTLKNIGYVSSSFTAQVDNPILVSVEYTYPTSPTAKYQVWYTPFQEIETTFTVSPSQPLVRTYTWNQTNTQVPQFWNTTYKAGTCYIEAFIPKKGTGSWEWNMDALFRAWIYINVTET